MNWIFNEVNSPNIILFEILNNVIEVSSKARFVVFFLFQKRKRMFVVSYNRRVDLNHIVVEEPHPIESPS